MLIIISPAKTLDYESVPDTTKQSKPLMLDRAATLVEELRKKGQRDIANLMSVSDKIANLNVERYKRWSKGDLPSDSKQAVYAFMGDVYSGLNAASFDREDLNFAQKHLRILSGLYGVLRPLDSMQAHRLEMGTKLPTHKGDTLYEYWGDDITKILNKHALSSNFKFLINLASNEYFRAVNTTILKTQIIAPVFRDQKNGQYKIISFYAKKARGMMANFIIKNRISRPAELHDFSAGGYYFDKSSSADHQPVFLRDEQD